LGTIPVYGAGSSIVYTPTEAIAALRYYYSRTGLWSTLFGFGDAFSTDPHTFEVDQVTFQPKEDENGDLIIHPATWLNGPWVNHMIMGIDQGPMLLAIENYRSCMIWNLTGKNSNIKAGLDSIFAPDSGIEDDELIQIPKAFALHQNYPNPFNSSTTIKYDLPENSKVILKIYNILGQKTKELVNGYQKAGFESIVWDGKNDSGRRVSSGIYFYKLKTGEFSKTLKLVLIK